MTTIAVLFLSLCAAAFIALLDHGPDDRELKRREAYWST
jgi:hypothetical protein